MVENERVEIVCLYEFYFDDFEVGCMLQMGIYMVIEEEILIFVWQYDLQLFYIDV